MPLTTGTRLGPYEIQSQLGAGGMGEVYKARDSRLDRTVAIKVLPAHVATDPDLKQRFEREAKAIAALNHPHICTLHDIGSEGGTDFLVMEYLDGQTLAQRLENGALPLEEALQVAIAIADALDKAHRQGIVHRDLKPGNIMLTKTGAKLLDFGLAKLKTAGGVGVEGLTAQVTQSEPLTSQGSILGTLQYMAPEQLDGRNVDARSDVFAFGAVVYEMVTGRKAFESTSQASLIGAILHTVPPQLSAVEPPPPPLDRLVAKCLAKDPDRRWQTASDLVDELRWLSEAPAPGPTGAAVAPGPTAWRGPWILAGILAGAAVVGLLLTLAPWAPWRAVPAPRSTELTFTPFSFEQGGQRGAVWSPDGTAVAFAARQADTDPGADGYVAAHLNRRLSVPISARLARTRITPTQITVISFLIALVGAACFAVGRHWTAVIGALLVQLSSVVDGCDGELARLRHLATARGGWLDTMLDRYADAAVVVGITVGYAAGHPGVLPWLGGMAAITGFLLASYTTKEYALSHGAPYPNDWLNRPGCAAGRRNSRDHSGTQATARAKKREVDTVHAAVESLRRLSAS